ncbi:C40 family peptidase [Streptomyces galbus]|nr:hypothetical protein GCM10010335_11650 [Streptomyces galbus]
MATDRSQDLMGADLVGLRGSAPAVTTLPSVPARPTGSARLEDLVPPSPAEVQQRVNALYDRAETDTGTFNATRAMTSGARRGSGGRTGDAAVSAVARQWFDTARSVLGPTVPAVLPRDRTPQRPAVTSRPQRAAVEPAGARELESAERHLPELTARALPALPPAPTADGLRASHEDGAPASMALAPAPAAASAPLQAELPSPSAPAPEPLAAEATWDTGQVPAYGTGAVTWGTQDSDYTARAAQDGGAMAGGMQDTGATSWAAQETDALTWGTQDTDAMTWGTQGAGAANWGAWEASATPWGAPQDTGGFNVPSAMTDTGTFAAPSTPMDTGSFSAPSASMDTGGYAVPSPFTDTGGFSAPLPLSDTGSFSASLPLTDTGSFSAPFALTDTGGFTMPSVPTDTSGFAVPSAQMGTGGFLTAPVAPPGTAPGGPVPASFAPDPVGHSPVTPDTVDYSPAPTYPAKADKAVAFARAQLGKPCVWGAKGPDSYDCSGLTQAAWTAAGLPLPRATADQAGAGTPVELDDLRPGDLVFFFDGLRHTGLCTGNGLMIHAPGPGAFVREESIFHAGQDAIRAAVRPA